MYSIRRGFAIWMDLSPGEDIPSPAIDNDEQEEREDEDGELDRDPYGCLHTVDHKAVWREHLQELKLMPGAVALRDKQRLLRKQQQQQQEEEQDCELDDNSNLMTSILHGALRAQSGDELEALLRLIPDEIDSQGL